MDCRVVVYDAASNRWADFRRPVEILCTTRLEDVLPMLGYIDAQVAGGNIHAAGFLAYEASPAFDAALSAFPAGNFPLLWFGLFRDLEFIRSPETTVPDDPPLSWSPTISKAGYQAAIHRIREHIREGETYQTNYSFRLTTAAPVDAWGYFARMIRDQGAGFGAFVDTGRWVICSASPELFFLLDGNRLVSKPMKGTTPRACLPDDDRRQAQVLRESPKNRAENLMIVDMVRNDMGRIAKSGTVEPVGLFEVERYPTLWQMTSTVACRTDSPFPEIVGSLFPAASITGAPKVRTMEIIHDLESTPRRIYTGTIGFLSPGRRAQFNVAIRTLLIDAELQTGEYGIGSGIVWDSEGQSEFAECLLKAAIVTRQRPDFSLLETMLWTPRGGYFLLDRHLERVMESAAYFGRACDRERVVSHLESIARRFPPHSQRIRLLLPGSAEPHTENTTLTEEAPHRIGLAGEPIDSNDVFLYHKTTHRAVYDRALNETPGYDDVLLWNERGEITESTRANVVVEMDGELFTPPVRSGLLPGVYRAHLLAQGTIRESVVRKKDLARCSRIFLINSVRRMWEVRLEDVVPKGAD
jgi:para-aminobenzoate synthetase / 4-amino-4-deoxychorismate lyase